MFYSLYRNLWYCDDQSADNHDDLRLRHDNVCFKRSLVVGFGTFMLVIWSAVIIRIIYT